MTDQIPAHQLAHFDQAFTKLSEMLDEMVSTHRDICAERAEPREVSIAGMAAYLVQEADLETLAELLAVAVSRLAAGPKP